MADTVQDYTEKVVPPICLDAPWYIHNTKKACFVRLRECPYAPIHLDAPICLDAHCVFGCPYVWMPLVSMGAPICLPVCLDAPLCLDTPICLDSPICLDDAPCTYTTQRKHALSD